MFKQMLREWSYKNGATRALIVAGRSAVALMGLAFTLKPGTAMAIPCSGECTCWWNHLGSCSSQGCTKKVAVWSCRDNCGSVITCYDCYKGTSPVGHCI